MNQETRETGDELLRRVAARRRRDTAVIAVLTVLAVLGGGHAVADFFTDDPVPVTEPVDLVAGQALLVGSFAQQYIVTYLSSTAGQQDRLDAYVSDGQRAALPSGSARQVSEPMVVFALREVTSPALDVWSVTVSVRVSRGAATSTEGRQYYRVGISSAQGRLRALALPAVVSPPSRGVDLRLVYSAPCAAGTPLADVTSGFLAAFLTGTGDVNRYTSVDSGIEALNPAPFTGVAMLSVVADESACGTSGYSARVLATVQPKAAGGDTVSLSYPLRLRMSGGQWQVWAMDAVPALVNPLTANTDPRSGGRDAGALTTTTASPSGAESIPPATRN